MNCKATVRLENDVFTFVGSHKLYQVNDRSYIDNPQLLNATKERCAKEQVAKKYNFHQEAAK